MNLWHLSRFMQNCSFLAPLFPSTIIVDVTADGVITREGLMLPSYEAWCSARDGSLSCCDHRDNFLEDKYNLNAKHLVCLLDECLYGECIMGLAYTWLYL